MVERFHNEYKNGMDSQFSMHFGQLSWTTNPQTGNQIAELGKRLNEGVKNVELGSLSQDVMGAIPQQHFEEAQRLSKLTETKLSFHAPLTDPAGFTQNGWHEHQRQQAEEEFKGVIDRAQLLNKDGNVTVNFHSSGGGLASRVPVQRTEEYYKKTKEAREKGLPLPKEELQYMGVVNVRTGQLQFLPREEVSRLTDEKELFTPEERLELLNENSWDKEKLEFMSLKKQKEEVDAMQDRWRTQSQQGEELLQLDIKKKASGLTKEEEEKYKELQLQDYTYGRHKNEIERNILSQLNELYADYTKSYKPEETYENLKYKENIERLKEYKDKFVEQSRISKKYMEDINNYLERNGLKGVKSMKDLSPDQLKFINDKERAAEEEIKSRAYVDIDEVSSFMVGLPAPKRWAPVEDHAMQKASETFANVALYGYEKYKDKAPLISVENVYPEWTLSRAESLKKMIEISKKKLISKLREKKHMGEKEAEKVADKVIGVTWDVSHIFQLRKYGYSKEDIVKEAKKIAKHVKHLHITDNFGYSDSHLAPGMGDVPIKEQLSAIEKAIGKEKFRKIPTVIEAGGVFAQLQDNPVKYAVEERGMNSPFYAYDHEPSWTDVRDVYASYLYGYGNILPEQHFKTQGAGFSLLPKELGGQVGGTSEDRGRFASSGNGKNQ